ncbi:MAG TPA: hypothetical protein VFS91_00080 [Nitrobacter sp.]|nr:hypothetical protein [Nitrobacter sp.]
MTEDTRNFFCFMGTLAAIVALSKIGGTGADLAIMTGLIGVLGMLARPARDKPHGEPDHPKQEPEP